MSGRALKVAFLVVDNREAFKDYQNPHPFFGTAPEALLQGFVRMPQDIEVHVVTCCQHPMKSPARIAENIHFHSLHVPKWGWLRSGYSGCIRAVQKRLRELQPDLIHAQGTERECALAGAWGPWPRILTVHGNLREIEKIIGFRPFSAMWLQTRLESFTVQRYQGAVCITSYTQKALAGDLAKTWVVPNAVDVAFFDIPRSRPVANRILCVAHIDPRKNQVALMEASVPLPGETAPELVFFGSLPESDYGRAFREALSRYPWCRYGGRIGREQLREELSQAGGLILASLEDNCPMVILEAMAAGVPVAASAVGGIPQLIQDGLTGCLLDPLDKTDIRRAVNRLLVEGSEWSEAARDYCLKQHHPQHIASRHVEIYREVLGV